MLIDKTVLVTDARYKNTLAIVRSLGKRKFKVIVSGQKIIGQSFYSRFCDQGFLYPDPRKNMDGFIRFMIEVVKTHNYDVLLPVGVRTTVPISYHKDEFEPYVKTPIADFDTLIKAHDKPTCLQLAKRYGVPIPKTYFPENREEMEQLAGEIEYPVVVKIRRGSSAQGLRYANSPEELVKKYPKQTESNIVFNYKRPMIQEYVPGSVHDVCTLFRCGEPKATLTQKRIKMFPVTGGGGVVNVTTDEPDLRNLAIRFLRNLKWHGPAQVEFKMDSRDGAPKLMEVNSKFWGTLDLSIQAGIDFPYLACKMAIEGDIDAINNYHVGLKYRWLLPHELRYAIQSRNKYEALHEFLDLGEDFKHDIWPSDIVPIVMRTASFFGRRMLR